MPTRAERHTEQEVSWASGAIGVLPKITTKQIIEMKVCEEFHQKFGKTLTPTGMYSWLRCVKDPELKRNIYARACERNRAKKDGKEPRSNAKFLREKETFDKSNILAYVNHHIVGFETDVALKEFLMQNQVIGENICVFKKTPIKIEYNITIGV